MSHSVTARHASPPRGFLGRLSSKVAFFLAAAAMAATFAPLAFAATDEAPADGSTSDGPPARIEVAFVLDTTGSMSGLIEGAKEKIWSIASNMMDLEPRPELRIALIGYRDRGDAYVTRTYPLTTDVQDIYAKLLQFKADGGGDNPESVNQALSEAVDDLGWSQEDAVFRTLFLVGDAPPHMDYPDDRPYAETVAIAVEKDIVVNAIQAGGQRVTTKIWREIATLGGGSFAQIAQDGAMTAVETPFDGRIEALNMRLSDTVTPYGDRARREKTDSQRALAREAKGAAAAEMNAYLSKKSLGGARSVVSGGGDLIEDVEKDVVRLDTLSDEELPDDLRALSPEARTAAVSEKIAERAAIRAELDALLAERAAYIAERRDAERGAAASADAFDLRVDALIEEQAARKGFVKK